MKPAGLSKIFAYFFILALMIHPAAIFGMSKSADLPHDPGNFGQAFYAVSLQNGSAPSKVVLASSSATFKVSQVSSAETGIGVVEQLDSYPQLKLVALDFSQVKISVVSRQAENVVLKVLPVSSLLHFVLAGQRPFSPGVLGLSVAPAVFDRMGERFGIQLAQASDLGPSSEILIDVLAQSTLVLRC